MAPSSCTLFSLILLVANFYHPVLSWQPQVVEKPRVRFCFKFTVHVINGLSTNQHPLFIHCQSRDDDLGGHTLYKGGDFNFRFGVKFIGPKTWFTCDMTWGSKHQHVDVFRQKIEGSMCCNDGGNICYWRAQDDGIYFSVDNEMWLLRYDWLQ
ncbi:conserved hypothetical protein [Ricinus communis]|uniref:S-protein homolog n=1 Tax=Ricinus communis TaxID=3988 RepID=B9RWQ8_RICCO|nr:conserved hypothetical protein [Ricinus communis]|eukprot:XP_002518177.1 S-protein homolog 24 [Ricinus communis]